jgi:hypothetical protein
VIAKNFTKIIAILQKQNALRRHLLLFWGDVYLETLFRGHVNVESDHLLGR